MVRYTAHELRHVSASLPIASGASDMQDAYRMEHSRIETTKNIYGHLFAWDKSAVFDTMNQAVRRLQAYEEIQDGESAASKATNTTDRKAGSALA